jgi:toxin ParE1/3/4
MATVHFSSRAAQDMTDIAIYTLSNWGELQMMKYTTALEQCAWMLAENPKLGRSCSWILPDMRRFEKEQHVFYYLSVPDGVLIARVLHQAAQPERHEFEDEEPNQA